MLCPEVWNFPPSKVITYKKCCENEEVVRRTVEMNSFYKSVIITSPDNDITDNIFKELLEDTTYYKIKECPITEFVDRKFTDSFVGKGHFYCLSINRNCLVENCAAITPDGFLIIHVLDFIFQTLGLEGIKRPNNFFEIKIDLKNIKNPNKVKQSLCKIGKFNFYLTWEPVSENVCPSSVAKYFHDKGYTVTAHELETKQILRNVTEIPSVEETNIEEMVEWIGMLAVGGDISPKESYISSYSQPESEFIIKSSRVKLHIIKGFVVPSIVHKVYQTLSECVLYRESEHLWTSVSIQSYDHSLWQWTPGSQKMFQEHDSSCNIFIKHNKYLLFLIGQLKCS